MMQSEFLVAKGQIFMIRYKYLRPKNNSGIF